MGPGFATFIKAIFIGVTAAGGPAGAGYAFAVNLARVALLAVIAKITAPKLDLSDRAQTKTFTVRDPVAPQQFIYGEDLVSGPIIFGDTSGNENRDLDLLIALACH